MIRRLRLRFVCVNMAIVLVMLCAMMATVYVLTRQNVRSRSADFLRTAAEDPARAERRSRGDHPPFLLLEIDGAGEVEVLVSGGVSIEDPAQLEELAARTEGRQEGFLRDYCLRFCSSVEGQIRRLALGDTSGEQWAMEGMLQTFGFIALLSLAVFFLISLLLARWAVGPVEEAWRSQRQFVADASHELKTPLTVILANAEMLQSSGGLGDRDRQRSENIAAGARQMRGLVESLLELARADCGLPRSALVPLDFSALVERAVLPFEAVFFESGHPLRWDVQPGLWVKGCPQRLEQVVDILLDNANKYAAPGGAVEAGLRREDKGRALLWVRSQGPAIPRKELERIFRRFYRVDAARSASGSYGLGLSIARGIAAEHRGKIWAESGEEGNTFFVRLPLDRKQM